jgi:dipeptidyl aminopeptidase/acylaminoacyl peptidase
VHRFGAWSKDGREILYVSNARNNIDFDLYRMNIDTRESELVREWRGNRTILAWLEDRQCVLSTEQLASEQDELYLLDLKSGEERHITAGHPQARYEQARYADGAVYLISDRTHDRGAICRLNLEDGSLEEIVNAGELDAAVIPYQGELELLAVKGGGKAAFALNVEGYSRLYKLDIASRTWEQVGGLPSGVIAGLKFSPDGRRLVSGLQAPQRPPDVWEYDFERDLTTQLTFSNHAGINASEWIAPELIRFPTFDGRQIPAFYYRPATPPPAGGYPCILYVHGGPAGQQRPDFDLRFQYFLSRGYALLVTNVRGSTGYGRAYMQLDDLELRMDSVADLKHAVLWLRERAEIDAQRIAIYGRSYGGYMVLAAMTEYPELFAAGVDVVGIANWETFMERTSPWRRAHREREYGSLENHRDLLRRISPIHKAERITAPLLVIAGDNDPRVPLYESEQIVERVRNAGGTVEFIHYADEGHKIAKLPNLIDSFTQMGEFLRRTIGKE